MNIDKKFFIINLIFFSICLYAILHFTQQNSQTSNYSGKLLCLNRLQNLDSINIYNPQSNSHEQIYTTSNIILKTLSLSGQIYSLEKSPRGQTFLHVITESDHQFLDLHNRYIHDFHILPQSQRLLLLTQQSITISNQVQPANIRKIELYNPKSRIFSDLFPQPPQPIQNLIVHPNYDIFVYKDSQQIAHYYQINNKHQTILGNTNYLYDFDPSGNQILAQYSPVHDTVSYPKFQIFQSNQQTTIFEQQARYRDAILHQNAIYASKSSSVLSNGESLYQIVHIDFQQNPISESTILAFPDFSLEYPKPSRTLPLLAIEKISRNTQLNLSFANSRYLANTLRAYESDVVIYNLQNSTIQNTFPCRQPLWL